MIHRVAAWVWGRIVESVKDVDDGVYVKMLRSMESVLAEIEVVAEVFYGRIKG